MRHFTDEDRALSSMLMHDPTGKILYCPPVFGIDEGRHYSIGNLYTNCTMEEEKNRRGAVLMTLPLQ